MSLLELDAMLADGDNEGTEPTVTNPAEGDILAKSSLTTLGADGTHRQQQQQRWTTTTIPCCLCGASIVPNAANQCGSCLAQQFDLKSTLQRGPGGGELVVHQCRQCRRFQRGTAADVGGRYESLELESPELLALCLKLIPALQSTSSSSAASHTTTTTASPISNIRVVDASWVWTEPHSMRLKVRMAVRADVGEGRSVTVQQRVVVEFMVRFKQCPDCKREFTNRTWQAVVQLRQKRLDGSPRKGLILLEMALAKNREARKHVVKIETTRHGFDFYFLTLAQAQGFASFLARVAPMRVKTSSKLVSSDPRNNTANVKHTVSCDMVPLCRDDLVVADRRTSRDAIGRLTGRLCLVTKCRSLVHLVDASPLRTRSIGDSLADLHPEKYWKAGGDKSYRIILSSKRMVRFIVLDVELCSFERSDGARNFGRNGEDLYMGPSSGMEKYALADVEVVRESDFGRNDESLHCVTHLGNLLEVGDVVLGYDLESAVFPSEVIDNFAHYFNSKNFGMPDVVLVKKVQGSSETDGLKDVDKEEGKPEHRSKSSRSKKRDKRARKAEKMIEQLEEAAARMGFLEDIVEEESDVDVALSDHKRAAFEEQLRRDPELARELETVEKEISFQQSDEHSQPPMGTSVDESGEAESNMSSER